MICRGFFFDLVGEKRVRADGAPPPPHFVSVADKGVTGVKSVSVDSNRVTERQLRSISVKTRSSSTSVHSKGVTVRVLSLRFAVNSGSEHSGTRKSPVSFVTPPPPCLDLDPATAEIHA